MTLKEYIDGHPLRYEKSPMSQYDETIFQLYECLDAIGFSGRMGYKDRALLKAWLTQIGLPMKEVEKYVREAIKHPAYQNP